MITRLEQMEPEVAPQPEQRQGALTFEFAKIFEAGKAELSEVVEATEENMDSYWAERLARANEERAAKEAQEKYSSFGGVMLWDASTAYSMYSAALSDVCERLMDVDAQPTTGTTRASRRPCLAPTLRQAVRAPRQPRPL